MEWVVLVTLEVKGSRHKHCHLKKCKTVAVAVLILEKPRDAFIQVSIYIQAVRLMERFCSLHDASNDCSFPLKGLSASSFISSSCG